MTAFQIGFMVTSGCFLLAATPKLSLSSLRQGKIVVSSESNITRVMLLMLPVWLPLWWVCLVGMGETRPSLIIGGAAVHSYPPR